MGNLNSIPRDVQNALLSENMNTQYSCILTQQEWIKIKQLNKETYQKIKEYENILSNEHMIDTIKQNKIITLQKYNIEILKNSQWNTGLIGVCFAGNIELAKVMIEKGANHWNGGLYAACEKKFIGPNSIASLMILKGANKCMYCNSKVNDDQFLNHIK